MTAAKGGAFYKDHLPLLGEDHKLAVKKVFRVGDRVSVDLELEVVKRLQNGHGGWSDGMKEVSTSVRF